MSTTIEDVAAAHAAIADAERRYRDVVRAARANGVKQVEIAKRLGRSEEMVRQDAMPEEELAELRAKELERQRARRDVARQARNSKES